MGEWSFGDMADHLLGWRDRTIARLEALSLDELDSPNPWPAELDDDNDDDNAINAWIHDRHTGRTPAQLVGDYDASYSRLVAVIDSMSNDKLTDPNAIPGIGGPLVDIDFTDHLHDEHVPSVRAWLHESGSHG